MRQADLEHTLRGILEDLEPYRSDLVLIGGWVPYLYRHYGGFSAWGGEDTLTFELDVLVERPLPSAGRPRLADVLRDAGFRPAEGDLPAAVWVRDADAGEQIEFITVHRGTAQVQGHVVQLTEQPGIGAIPLTGMEVMRSHTRVLALPPRPGSRSLEVQVPALGAYVVNKALTFIRRRPRAGELGVPKLAKDLLYLRDIAAGGEDVITAIRDDVARIVQSGGNAQRIETAATNLGFVAEGHLSHHLTSVAMMVVERDGESGIGLEEARTRAFLLDLRELLLASVDRHPLTENAGPNQDEE
jgi:hypothetical protein